VSTRTVTGTIHRSDDAPWYGARVGFALVDGTATMDTTYPEDGFAVTAADGTFSVDLAAGLPMPWRCALPDGDSFLFELPGGSPDPISIEMLRATYSPPNNLDIPTIIDINQVFNVGTASVQLVPAAANRGDTLVWNQGSATVYVAFGEAATTASFPLQAGYNLVVTTTQAINARSASGSQAVYILSEVHP
jgi:hypothetical protein